MNHFLQFELGDTIKPGEEEGDIQNEIMTHNDVYRVAVATLGYVFFSSFYHYK